MKPLRYILLAGLIGLTGASSLFGEASYENAPINYGETRESTQVTRLQEKIDAGEVVFEYHPERGYLDSLLKALNILPSSQVLVFSKTSFQLSRISPETPRAVYFGDETYVGWTQQGEVLEISSIDPQLGGVFYAMKQDPEGRPRVKRMDQDCLRCHGATLTRNTPGHMVRSVYTDANGQPILRAGTFITDHTSPTEERWGGWYVSGSHGDHRHMGNMLAKASDSGAELDTEAGANITDLNRFFNTKPYLTPHSDLISLMVLEHQTEMHNLITRANHETRVALHHQKIMDDMLERPGGELSDLSRRIITTAGTRLLRYLVFADEEMLTDTFVGTSDYTEAFQKQGPRDSQGRSLRELKLRKRLFLYPCSYLIYSEAFDAMPAEVRDYVYRGLYDILTSDEPPFEVSHMSTKDKTAILEILRETKPGLPNYWREDG